MLVVVLVAVGVVVVLYRGIQIMAQDFEIFVAVSCYTQEKMARYPEQRACQRSHPAAAGAPGTPLVVALRPRRPSLTRTPFGKKSSLRAAAVRQHSSGAGRRGPARFRSMRGKADGGRLPAV